MINIGNGEMVKQFDLVITDMLGISLLRENYIHELGKQVQDHIEQGVGSDKSYNILIKHDEKAIGYVCIGKHDIYEEKILEYYLIPEYRADLIKVLKKILHHYKCKGWFINTHDKAATFILYELKLPFHVSGYIFSHNQLCSNRESDFEFQMTSVEEIDGMYPLIRQNDFYPEVDRHYLKGKIEDQMFYSLYNRDKLIGVGFLDVLDRTPQYADIGMIVDPEYRGQGIGGLILDNLINECRNKHVIPTANCDSANTTSRKCLERAGFYIDGCILEVGLETYD